MVRGSLSNNSSINVELVVPPYVANGAMGFPKAVDWVLDLRDRRRVAVLGFCPGAFLPPFGKSLGERKRKEQELLWSPVSTDSDTGLALPVPVGLRRLFQIWFSIMG